MTNTQLYCDHCADRIVAFPDKLTVIRGDVGTLSLDLCWKCSKALHTKYQEISEETKKQRAEPLFLGQAVSK